MIWIDAEYKVHPEPGPGLEEMSTDIFEGMAPPVARLHIYVPAGREYTKPDGETVHGEFAQSYATVQELDTAQREYEREQYQALTAQLAAMDEEYTKGVNSL